MAVGGIDPPWRTDYCYGKYPVLEAYKFDQNYDNWLTQSYRNNKEVKFFLDHSVYILCPSPANESSNDVISGA